jgi:hypothetical protein
MRLFAKCNYKDRVKEDSIGKSCSTHGKRRIAYTFLVLKPEGKRPLQRSRYGMMEDVDLIKIGLGTVDGKL